MEDDCRLVQSSIFGLPSSIVVHRPGKQKGREHWSSRPEGVATRTVIGTLRPTERRRAFTTRTTRISESHGWNMSSGA